MKNYIFKRLCSLIVLLLGVSFLVFMLMYFTPGDILSEVRAAPDVSTQYIKQLETHFGLDKPWYSQYFLWLKHFLMLDFGQSWTYRLPVLELVSQRTAATLLLSICSLIFAWGIAIPIGILAAVYEGSLFDRVSGFLAYLGLSIPEFFLGLLGLFFAAATGLLPLGGRTSISFDFLSPWEQFVDYARHLILPTFVLGLGGIASIMRIMRANFLDHIRSEYVNTARAKGLSEGAVLFKHVLRNAINPLISTFGFAFSGLLSGSVLVENILNYPGLGQLVYEAFMKQDQAVVMAAVLIGCALLIIGNFIADLLLAWADPRIQ